MVAQAAAQGEKHADDHEERGPHQAVERQEADERMDREGDGRLPEEAEATIAQYLQTILRDPRVSLTRYDAVVAGESAQLPALDHRVQQLEKEVRELRSAIEKLQKQRPSYGPKETEQK